MIEVGGVYQHYKGGFYLVLYTALLEETLVEHVVYQSLMDSRIWVRPATDFVSTVSRLRIMVEERRLQKKWFAVTVDNALQKPSGSYAFFRSGQLGYTPEEYVLLFEKLGLDTAMANTCLEEGYIKRFKLVADRGVDIDKFKKENIL